MNTTEQRPGAPAQRRHGRRAKFPTRLAGAAAALLVVAGCGSAADTDDGGASAPPPAAESTVAATAAPTPTPTADTPTADAAPLDSETAAPAAEGAAAPNAQPAYASTALDVLATLPVKGRAPKTGYDRDQFGEAWADVDRNGCDTRNDMLQAQLTNIVFVNSVPCKVSTGVLADPYTGVSIPFQRGQGTSDDVQIDHVVALSDAWQKGAQQLTFEQRVAFANDPLNLQATDGPTNQRKGDGDAATWLPPNRAYRCEYVARQISVKAAYSLWVTQAEHDAMARVLGDCSGQLAPTNQQAPVQPAPAPAPAPVPAPVKPVPAPVPVPAPAPAGVPAGPAPAAGVNCSDFAAWAAAQDWYEYYLPTHGDIAGLDGNSDGAACESLPGAP